MILAICTSLVARANENIQQAGEMIFCNASSSLERYNTSVFIFSTNTPTYGIPLGVISASDEQQPTIVQSTCTSTCMLLDALQQMHFSVNGQSRA